MLTGPVPYAGFHAVQTFLCTGIGKDTGTTPKGRILSQRGPATTAAGGQALQSHFLNPNATQAPTTSVISSGFGGVLPSLGSHRSMRYCLPSLPVTSTLVVTSLASDNHLLGAITWMPEGRSDELFDT